MAYDLQAMLKDGLTPDQIADAFAADPAALQELAGQGALNYDAMKLKGMPDREIALAIINKTPQAVTPGPRMGLGERAVKSGARGLISATAGMPGDSVDLVNSLVGSEGRVLPNTDDVVRMVKEITGIDLRTPKPQGAAEKYTEAGATGVAGMLPWTRGGAAARAGQVLLGGAGGLVGEGAAETLGEPARMPADILTQLLAGGQRFRTPNIISTLKKELKEFSDVDLLRAQKKTNEAAATLGTRGPLTQGFDNPTALEGVTQEIVTSGKGGDIRASLAKQLLASMQKGKGFVDDLYGGGLEQEDLNRFAKAGKAAVDLPRETRTLATQGDYARANADLPPGFADAMNRVLEQRRLDMNLPAGSEGGKAFSKFGKKLENLDPNSESTVLNVAALAREEATSARAAKATKDPQGKALNRSLAEGAIAGDVKEKLKLASPEFDRAERKYKKYSAPVQAMAESQVPRYFDTNKPGAQWSHYTKLLDDADVTPGQIRKMARDLEQIPDGRLALPAIAKKGWMDKLDAVQSSEVGRVPQTAPGQFTTEISGMPGTQKREKFLTIVEETANLTGGDPMLARKGAEQLADALHVASRGRGTVGKVDTNELQHNMGRNWASSLLRIPGVLVGASPMAASLERWMYQKTAQKISDAFLSEKGIQQLMEIAKYSRGGNAAKVVAQTLLSSQAAEAAMNADSAPSEMVQ